MTEEKDIIREQMKQCARIMETMMETAADPLRRAAFLIRQSLENGGKILFCGNGGSAADSQHLAAEFVGRFRRERRGLPSIALTADTSVLTALGNDYGYERVFVRQVEALGLPGDVLVGLSTSGESRNVLLAVREAKNKGMKVVVFTGNRNTDMADLADAVVRVPSADPARIQEAHIAAGHILCDLVEAAFEKSSA